MNPMGLNIPTPTTTPGPQYAQQVSADEQKIAVHDHTYGNGVQVPTAGLKLDGDLPFNGFAAKDLSGVAFRSLTALVGSFLNRCVVIGGDLFFVDGFGRQVRITLNGVVVNGGNGNIQGLQAPASASFSPSTGVFAWQKGVGSPAAMDLGQLILRSAVSPTNPITLQVPSGVSAAWSLTLPQSPPGSALALVATPSTGGATLAFAQIGSAQIIDGSITQAKTAPIVLNGVPAAVGWTGAVQCWKDIGGVVHLEGLASPDHNVVANEVILRLPSGFRPAAASVIPASFGSAGTPVAPVGIAPTGEITSGISTGNQAGVSFDGITFRANP